MKKKGQSEKKVGFLINFFLRSDFALRHLLFAHLSVLWFTKISTCYRSVVHFWAWNVRSFSCVSLCITTNALSLRVCVCVCVYELIRVRGG